MALRDHTVINTNMSNRMLKFKTEVPKCQGVKLLKYKWCFNIPKHYIKNMRQCIKKHDALECSDASARCHQLQQQWRGSAEGAPGPTAPAGMWNLEKCSGLMTGLSVSPRLPPPHVTFTDIYIYIKKKTHSTSADQTKLQSLHVFYSLQRRYPTLDSFELMM